MQTDDDRALTRREILIAAAGSAAAWVGCGGDAPGLFDGGTVEGDSSARIDSGGGADGALADAGQALDGGAPLDGMPTPACVETDANILGPAYIEGAPIREAGELNVLGWAGSRLTLTGRVLGAQKCTPLAGAELDLWQADDSGCYDGSPIGCGPLSPEWPLRGRVITDAEGRYAFTTVYPGLYPGRTRHIHAIIRAAGHRELTTQLYFAGEPANATDGAILPSLTITLDVDPGGARSGVFDIILAPE